MLLYSLSSLDAEASLFPSCSPQISSTPLSHTAEKRDGRRFPEEVSWSQLRNRDLPQGAKPRQCKSKTTIASQESLKQHTLDMHIRKPPFLRNQWEIMDYINMKNPNSSKRVFLSNCTPLQLNFCGLCSTYSCYQKLKFHSRNRPGILDPTEKTIFLSHLLIMFKPLRHTSSTFLPSQNMPLFSVAHRQPIQCCRLYTNTH